MTLQKLEKLIGKDLVPFAYKYNISLSDKDGLEKQFKCTWDYQAIHQENQILVHGN